MVALQHRQRHSLTLALAMVAAAISLLALGSMVATAYLTITARDDARAINQTGSLRMQIWRLRALAPDASEVTWQHELASIDTTYQNLVTTRLVADPASSQSRRLQAAHRQWQQILRPAMSSPTRARQLQTQRIASYVARLDTLVGLMQRASEQRLIRLKWLQFSLLLLTLPLIGYGSYRLIRHVLIPLRRLLGVVDALRSGQLSARSGYCRNDEIGLLAMTIDDMAGQLDRIYRHLEYQLEDKSHRLQESHLALKLLYDNVRYLAATAPEDIDYDYALAPFSELLKPVTLSLLPADKAPTDESGTHLLAFPLKDAYANYGTLIATQPDDTPLPAWKRQICETVADHLRAAMALHAQSLHQRRLALMDERAVIARELHDSLAQSLSYLNIQALRLQRQLDARPDSGNHEPSNVLSELRQGIDHAYCQLRELLVTFRLRLTEQGINSALAATANEFAERGQLSIHHHSTLRDGLLAPDEELHVVQILREALANVVQHAKASHVEVALTLHDAQVMLSIEDNGTGLPTHLNRPCHYGMIIMQERASSLQGQLRLFSRATGGACVELTFTPKGIHHGN